MKLNLNSQLGFHFFEVALASRYIGLAVMLALADGETDWQSSGEGLAMDKIGNGIFNISISVCFPQPLNTEQFHQRGQGFNASSGRYTAPVSGFYQLTASLLLGT